ncbi:MAG: hypothetical protein M0Q92_02120 [Methanoregula sp.]|jgi:O-antigen/teichoic acid export membrane protein|nr:hypothetical protein [Methanoregula sp.]
MKIIETKKILLDDDSISDEKFEDRNLIHIISVGILLTAGSLFIYFGFYFLTSPFTVKWASLSIAIGFLVMAFGFSLWQDRQVQTLRRLQKNENGEIKQMLAALIEKKN